MVVAVAVGGGGGAQVVNAPLDASSSVSKLPMVRRGGGEAWAPPLSGITP